MGKSETRGDVNGDLLMRTRVPDLPKGSDNQRLGGDLTQIDPASEQHDPKPRNRSTTSPKVINDHA
jgi:hypothetical protein